MSDMFSSGAHDPLGHTRTQPTGPALDEADRAEMVANLSPTTTESSPSSVGILAEQTGMSEDALVAAVRDVEVNRWIADAQSYIEGLGDPDKVIAYWDRLSATERELLEAQGMSQPSGRWITRAAQSAFRAATRHNPIVKGAQGVLWGLGALDRVKNNYIRANLAMQEAAGQFDPSYRRERMTPEQARAQGIELEGLDPEQREAALEGGGFGQENTPRYLLPSTLNPATWKKFWDQTSDGEDTFWQDTLERIEADGIAGSDLEFAKGVASHLDTSGGPATREQLDSALMAELAEMIEAEDLTQEEAGVLAADIRGAFDQPDSAFTRAVNQLGANKLSAGRAAALAQGHTPGTPEFARHAGITDTVNAFVDPILLGGAGLKVVRGARFGITGSSSVARKSVRSDYRQLFPEPRHGQNVDPDDITESMQAIVRAEGAENVLKPSVHRWTRRISDSLNDEMALRVERANAKRLPGQVDPGARPRRSSISQLLQDEPKFATVIGRVADDIGLRSGTPWDELHAGIRRGSDTSVTEPGMQQLVDNGLVRITDDGAFAVNRQIDDADVLGYFTSDAGTQALLSGKAAGHLRHVPTVPHVTLSSVPARKLKTMMTQVIDWANDSPLAIWEKMAKKGKLTDEEYTRLFEQGGVDFGLKDAMFAAGRGAPVSALRGLAVTPIGRLMKQVTTTAPARMIDLNSEDAILQVQRFAQYLPSRIGRQLVDEFAAADSVGDRFLVMRSMFDEVFTRTGIKQVGDGEGAKFVNTFMRELDAHAAQRYALDDLDLHTLPSGRQHPAALILQQTSAGMRMPDIKQLYAYSKRSHFWWNVSGARMFNHGFWDFAVGKVWSPMVLLRLGFPIRAGGDELLQGMMREGGISMLRARLAHSATGDRARKGLLNPVWRSFSYLQRSARRNMDWYDTTASKLAARGDSARLMAMDQTARSYRWAEAGRATRDAARTVADLPRQGVRAVQRTLAGKEAVKAAQLLDEAYNGNLIEHLRHLHRQTDHFMTQRLNEIWSVSHGTGQFRFDQHLSEAEQARRVDAKVGRSLEDIIFKERFTGQWSEVSPSEDAELYFEWFRGRMEDLLAEDDTKIGLEILQEMVDEAMEESVAISDDVMAAFTHSLDSTEFAARFTQRWMERVQEDPRLTQQILDRLPHAKQLPNGRIYPGVDSFDELLGTPGFGRVVLPRQGVDDGLGIWSLQDEAGEMADYAGIGPRIEGDLDADAVAARLAEVDDGARVVDVDFDGDWRGFDLDVDQLTYDEYEALQGRIQLLIEEGFFDDLPTSQAYREFVENTDEPLRHLLDELDELEPHVGETAQMREAIEAYRRGEVPDELIDIELPRTLDEPVGSAGLIDLDRPGGPPRPASPQARYNDAVARFERILTETQRLARAIPDDLGPLARLAGRVPGMPGYRTYDDYADELDDALKALARQGVDPTSVHQRRIVEELQQVLETSRYTGLEQTTETGRRIRTVFDPDRVRVTRNHDAANLRSINERWATRDEALRNVGGTLHRLLRQRLFTSPEQGSSVPLPGALRRMVQKGETLEVDELKALHYGNTDVQQGLTEEYAELLGGLPSGRGEDLAEGLAARQLQIDETLTEEFGEQLAEHGLDDISQVLLRASEDESLRPLADQITDRLEQLDTEVPTSHLNFDGVSTQMPVKTFGPEQAKEINEISAMLWDKPFQVMGQMIDYISREPMFVHNFARALDQVSPGMWQARGAQRAILDDLLATVDSIGSDLSEAALRSAGRKARKADLGTVTHDDTLTDSLAAVNPETGAIRINRAKVAEDYDNGLAYLRGDVEGAPLGSIQKTEAFQRQGVDLDELHAWFEANGGTEAYERFIIAHERGHMALSHPRSPKSEWLQDHTILREMEANQVAFHALDMPWKGTVEPLEFSDSRGALDHLQRLRARVQRERQAGFHADTDLALEGDEIGAKLLEVARRAEANGFERLPNETNFAFTQRVFDRVWEAEGDIVGTALANAVETTMPYVDSVPIASTMAVMGRNMVPFWWAEERFLKRLAQTIYHSPESIKKAQLTYEGLRHMGAIQTDDNGQDYFIYPGAGVTHEIMAGILTAATGEDYTVPQVEQVTGRVLFSLPGLDQLGRPVPGPAIALPSRVIGDRFPLLRGVTDSVIGDYAANRQIGNLELVLPSTMSRAMSAWSPQQAQEQYTSAYLQAMQTLVANGHDLEVDPETGIQRPMDPEDFEEKVGRLTHIIAGLRVAYGFAGFAPPSIEFPEGNEVREELFKLVDVFGFSEGLAQWQERFPDASPYQVFSTETAGGTSIPATRETLEFMERHEDFLDAHPRAAAYLMPTPEVDTGFELEAWLKQNELGLRQRRDSEEFYRSVKFAQAAPVYFQRQEEYQAVRERYTGTPYAAEVDNRWARWQDRYFAMHPTFRDELQSSDRRERRQQILDEVGRALNDPDLPPSTSIEPLRKLYDGYMEYRHQMNLLSGFGHREPYKSFKNNYKQQFLVWADWVVEHSPSVEPFFQRIVLPEVGVDQEELEEELAATGTGG